MSSVSVPSSRLRNALRGGFPRQHGLIILGPRLQGCGDRLGHLRSTTSCAAPSSLPVPRSRSRSGRAAPGKPCKRAMRLEGFEPPTRGLEGRRSSAELQAPLDVTMPSVDAMHRSTACGSTLRLDADGSSAHCLMRSRHHHSPPRPRQAESSSGGSPRASATAALEPPRPVFAGDVAGIPLASGCDEGRSYAIRIAPGRVCRRTRRPL
jgi:hypothetical protein